MKNKSKMGALVVFCQQFLFFSPAWFIKSLSQLEVQRGARIFEHLDNYCMYTLKKIYRGL